MPLIHVARNHIQNVVATVNMNLVPFIFPATSEQNRYNVTATPRRCWDVVCLLGSVVL